VKFAEIQQLKAEELESLATASSRELFSNPSLVAASLSLSTQLAAPDFAQTESLLDAVATALTAVPEVSLDQLLWVRIEDDNVYESLNSALGGVPHRQRIEEADNAYAIQLELAGSVSGAQLAHQKSQLDEFIDQLSLMSYLVELDLLESPVDSALSSDFGKVDAGRYRVSLKLGSRQ